MTTMKNLVESYSSLTKDDLDEIISLLNQRCFDIIVDEINRCPGVEDECVGCPVLDKCVRFWDDYVRRKGVVTSSLTGILKRIESLKDKRLRILKGDSEGETENDEN